MRIDRIQDCHCQGYTNHTHHGVMNTHSLEKTFHCLQMYKKVAFQFVNVLKQI